MMTAATLPPTKPTFDWLKHFFRLAVLGIVNLSLVTWAQAETRTIDHFTSIDYALPFNVELIASNSPFVRLDGDQDTIDEVLSEVDGHTLKLYRERSWFDWSDEEIHLTIGYTDLTSLGLTGSGDVYAEHIDSDQLRISVAGSAAVEIDDLLSHQLEVNIAGSGNVNLNRLQADTVTTHIAGSGDAHLRGNVISQHISIAGSGDYDAGELRAQEVDAKIVGSGDAIIWALTRLSVSVMGSGDVEYYGEPRLNQRIMGSGDVKRISTAP